MKKRRFARGCLRAWRLLELEEVNMLNLVKLPVLKSNVALRVSKGHFVTNHSHINYYIDVTFQKSRLSEAQATAKALARQYVNTTIVDTILCLDGMEVVGTCLAEELTKAGVMSINAHQTIYVVTPETSSESQLFFRESLQPMIRGKHVLILLASATTGITASRSADCVRYYGGCVAGLSAIYSAIDTIEDGTPINALFHVADLPDYAGYSAHNCPMCRRGEKIDALVTGNGYSTL